MFSLNVLFLLVFFVLSLSQFSGIIESPIGFFNVCFFHICDCDAGVMSMWGMFSFETSLFI